MFLFYCVQNLLVYKCYGYFFFCLKIHIYFQKSTHISHSIPESQNAIHNIYSRRKLSEEIKANPVSLCGCRASRSKFYVSHYPKILRASSLKCMVSYKNKNQNLQKKSFFHLGSPFKKAQAFFGKIIFC